MQLEHQWLGTGVEYQAGLEIQQQLVNAILSGNPQYHLLTLEHAPVYTIGRTRDLSSLGQARDLLPHPVIEINRGGQATYHGPGQLTGYPIVDLHLLGKDLHAYIRTLEQTLITVCASYGVQAGRREGLTGVWVETRKLASIGVGVKKWISMHGFAINLRKESLTGFQSITPCGIDNVAMTSLESECGDAVNTEEFATKCYLCLQQNLAGMTTR